MNKFLQMIKNYFISEFNYKAKISGMNRKKLWKETWQIAVILVLVFGFRASFFEPFRIPSGSMIPTLMIGDFILVNKMAYGFKVPFSDWFGHNPIYLSKFKEPNRGDIVIFRYPKDPSFNYIKRLIGLPGDEIEIVNKMVYVNGEEMKLTPTEAAEVMKDMDEKFKIYDFNFYKAKTGEHEHMVQSLQYLGPKDNMDRFKVPEGQYFVMGDNRDFSADSRYWGFVPRHHLRGRAMFVWFSMIIPFLDDHPFKFRPYRIGTALK